MYCNIYKVLLPKTAGAARHNGFYPPAEKRAFDCNAFKPFPGDGKGLFSVYHIKSPLPKPICKWNEVNFKCPVQRFWKLRRLLLLI